MERCLDCCNIKLLQCSPQQEEEGLIDLSNAVHLFCVSYVFIPRIHTDLHFIEMWNCHPLRTEGNLSPNQLWNIGMLQAPVSEPDFAEVCIT